MANDAVKVFIGTSSNGEDAKIEIAYEHSIRKNCSRPVDITWMRQTNDETSFWHGWADKNWSTPFSGFRKRVYLKLVILKAKQYTLMLI